MSTDEDKEETKTDEISKLEREKTIAETQKAIVEAQKATIQALIPETQLKPQEGKTEADTGFGYIAELVAYQSLKEQTKEIGKEIDQKLDKTKDYKVLIVRDLDFATDDLTLVHLESLFAYYKKSIEEQLVQNNNLITEVLGRQRRGVFSAAVLAAMGTVGVAADILGYLKTDYKITGQDFTLDDHAIYANVANNITKVPVYIFKFNLIEDPELFKDFENLLDKKNELHKSMAQLKSVIIKKLNATIEETKQTTSQLEAALEKLVNETDIVKKIAQKINDSKQALEETSAKLDEVNSAVLASDTILTAFSSFVESITKTPEDKTPPLLLKATLRKYIRTKKFTHLLNLKITSAGGEAITMQQRLGKSGKLIFIGGCSISYILVETDGTYVMANTHHGLAHLNYDLGKKEQTLKVQKIGTLQNT